MNENDSTLRSYLRSISQEPLLTREEEVELAARVHQGDQEAVDRLVKSNLRLVVKIAQHYKGLGVSFMDLIAEGNTGLMKAAERFDPAKGGKMSTYAAWWIKQAIKRALSNQSKTIRLPTHLVEKLSRIRKYSLVFLEDNGRSPTNQELAEYMGVKPGQIAHWKAMSVNPTSMDAPLTATEDSGTFGDLLHDEAAKDAFKVLDEEQVRNSIRSLLRHLDERELRILNHRYGLNGQEPETLERVGERFRITRERVRQIQKSALEKLRSMFEEYNEPRLSADREPAISS